MLKVTVEFPPEYPAALQGPALLHMELALREAGYNAQVLKELHGDDSKLRTLMTIEQRARL